MSSVRKHWQHIQAFLARRIRYRITRGGVLFTFAMVVVGVGAIVSANNLLFLIVAAMIVFILNPLVRRLVAVGVPRRLAATVVFVAFVVSVGALLDVLVPRLISQAASLTGSAPGLVRKGGTLFDRLAGSSNPLLHRAGTSAATWLEAHAGNAPQALRSLTDAGLRLAHAGLVLLLGGFLGFLLLL